MIAMCRAPSCKGLVADDQAPDCGEGLGLGGFLGVPRITRGQQKSRGARSGPPAWSSLAQLAPTPYEGHRSPASAAPMGAAIRRALAAELERRTVVICS